MKYYEMHEIVYKKLKDEKYLSWDKSTTFEEMWSHSTNVYLEKMLNKLHVSVNGLEVLDLGTGTGTSALFVEKNGANCTGVEVSSSALDIARNNAQKLGLKLEFICGDVLDVDLNKKFDLIIDSTVLHCIVEDSDRAKFYKTVKRHLKRDGLFFVNTMIVSDDMVSRFPKEYFFIQDDVLWSLGINEISERKVIDGKSYFPHRTLLSKERQLEEFHLNGFEVVELCEVIDKDGYDLVALLKIS